MTYRTHVITLTSQLTAVRVAQYIRDNCGDLTPTITVENGDYVVRAESQRAFTRYTVNGLAAIAHGIKWHAEHADDLVSPLNDFYPTTEVV